MARGGSIVPDGAIAELVESAARPYRCAGRFAWRFARAKLRRDPVYLALLRRGLIPDRARVLDLGCGQGLPFALLIAARAHYLAGSWPATWPAPPTDPELHGIELRSIDVERARLALGERVVVEELDLRDAKLATSDVILLLDVLHYLDREAQEWLLETAMSALAPAGLLILRVGDAAAGFATLAARAIDRTVGLVRDRRVPSLHVRNSSEWIGLLEGMGMTVEAEPMSEGTPFANVLLVARKTRP